MSTTPNSFVTPQALKTFQVVATAAKSTYGDATNAVRLVNAAANVNGLFVKRLFAITRSSCGATQLQAYRSPDGVTMNFADSALLPAYSLASTTAAAKGDFGYTNDFYMRLQAGEELWVATGAAVSGGAVFIAECEVL